MLSIQIRIIFGVHKVKKQFVMLVNLIDFLDLIIFMQLNLLYNFGHTPFKLKLTQFNPKIPLNNILNPLRKFALYIK